MMIPHLLSVLVPLLILKAVEARPGAVPAYTRYVDYDSYGNDISGGTYTNVLSEGRCSSLCSSWGPQCTGYVYAYAIPAASPFHRYCWLKQGTVRPVALSAGGSTWTKQGLVVGIKLAARTPAPRPVTAPALDNQSPTGGIVRVGSLGDAGDEPGAPPAHSWAGEQYVLCHCKGTPCNQPVGSGKGVRRVGTMDCVNCLSSADGPYSCAPGWSCKPGRPSTMQDPSMTFATCYPSSSQQSAGGYTPAASMDGGSKESKGNFILQEALGTKSADLANAEETAGKVVGLVERMLRMYKATPSKDLLPDLQKLSAALKKVAALTDKAALACTYRCLGCAVADLGKSGREYHCIDDCAFNVLNYRDC